jgi:hypothetical protein
MRCINATGPHRKSGQWGTQPSLPVKDGGLPRQLLLAQFDGIQGVSLVVKALDTSISRRVACVTLTLKYPQNSYAELRPRVFNTGCCRYHRGFEPASVVLMLVE